MKKVLSCLLICAMLLSFLPVVSMADGEVTVITDASTFKATIEANLTGHYELGGNITLPATYEPIEYFQGTLDGKNHTITLSMNGNNLSGDATAYGLFATLKSGATIQNLTLAGSVTGRKGQYRVGALAGVTDSTGATLTINNVTNRADVYFYSASTTAQAGGLIGYVRASANTVTNISNCVNYGTVQPATDNTDRGDSIGGIVGQIESVQGSISKCYNYGEIKNANTGRNTGGILGMCSGGGYTVEYCGNYGTITSSDDRGAGIVSYMNTGSTVTKCFNAGTISCAYGAGIVYNDNYAALSIDNCFNAGTVTGGHGIINGHGAINAYKNGPTAYTPVTNCYNVGSVTGNPISNVSNASIAATAANNYYLAGSAGKTTSADISAGKTKEISEADLKAGLPAGFDPAIWEMPTSGYYPYPQLKGNYYVMTLEGEDKVNYAGGNGTKMYPYQIANATHFANISKNPSAYFEQTADFTVSEGLATTFTGKYDGKNHTIELAIVNTDANVSGTGLFKSVDNTSGGVLIQNLILDGELTSAGTANGALIGNSAGATLENIVSKVIINTSGANTGGLVGANGVRRITITNCRNEGNITTTAQRVGGIAGNGYHVYGTNLVNTGIITGKYITAGIVGGEHATLMQCYNAGTVIGDNSVAGIIGEARGNVTDCYNVGRIVSKGTVGGAVYVAHANANITVTNCFNAGEVVGATGAAQVVAKAAANTYNIFSNCYYLDPTADGETAENGVTAVNKNELKSVSLGASYSANSKGYPQLTNNKQSPELDIALLTVAAAENGTITPGTRYLPVGASTTQTYTGKYAYRLDEAKLDDVPLIDGAAFQVTGDATLTATFEEYWLAPSVTVFEAAFADAEGDIAFATVNPGVNYEVKEYGFIYAADEAALATSDAKLKAVKEAGDKGQFGIRVLWEGLGAGSYYVKPYVIYDNDQIVYGETALNITQD